MEKIYEKKCEPCRGDSPKANQAEIQLLMPQIPEWNLVEEANIKRLKRSFKFRNFKEALDFTIKVGQIAEEEGHHPDILTGWGHATVTWYTHKIKGLHVNDFVMASKTDRLLG